jgi:DUF4097 and DUF4098 domain-containing protein YvlB
MKALKFAGLAIVALTLSTRLQAQNTQQLVVPLSEPGKPFKLNVDIVTGSIKVTVYDGKDVIIDGQTSHPKREEKDNKSGMKRITGGDDLDIFAKEKNNAVSIGTGMPGKNISLTVKIPQGVSNVKLYTVNGGSIVADGISADVEANNTNGAIKLSNMSGSVVANTTNGNVTVSFKSIDAKAAMAFTTLNGNVDVTFPAGLKANIKARSDQGNVYSDFDMVTEKSPAKSTKIAKEGMYRITIEDWVYGKIGGGGPEFLFKNMNGNIYIRKAK